MEQFIRIYLLIASLLVFSCSAEIQGPPDQSEFPPELQDGLNELQTDLSLISPDIFEGLKLFVLEKFDGNDRTCRTCHRLNTGERTLESIQRAFNRNPNDPLFRAIDSDDGNGTSFTRLLTHGTFSVEIPLAPNVRLADNPTANTVRLNRGSLPVNNIALDPFIMWDGREPDLEIQALNAAINHAEITETPTQEELEQIALFQTELLFSSFQLFLFANGGPAPVLPPGNTPSEIRGREFFIPQPNVSNCALCHSGPMLNEGTPFGLGGPAPISPGARFLTTLVSLRNLTGEPVKTYNVTNPDSSVTVINSPDPGRMLITGDPADNGRFKIPTLWGSKNTAPYFHDNSAKNFEDLMEHYQFAFGAFTGIQGFFSEQDKQDIINYLKLL